MQRVATDLGHVLRIAASLVTLAALGCTVADTAAVESNGDTTTGEPGPGLATDDGETTGGSAGEAGSESLTADSTSAASETSDPTGDESPSAEPCDLAACEPGACVVGEDGEARCECPEGTIAAGLQCLVCEAVEEEFDVTIGATDVSLSVTYSGQAFPASQGEQARVWLRDPSNGELIGFGNPADGLRTARVVPRVYEVVYGHLAGSVVPANKLAAIDVIDVRDTESFERAIDIPTVELSGNFSFDGAAAAGLDELGNVWLRHATSGDEVFLGRSDGGSYAVTVIPGDYEIHFEWRSGTAVVPRNQRGLVGTVTVGGGAQVHDIDVQTIEVAGSFAFDGVPAPTSADERASFFLHDARTGEEFPIGVSDGGGYAVRVIPGVYDLVLSSPGGAVAPGNAHARLRQLDTGDAESYAIDVATSRITGAITIDDGPAPTDPADDGRLTLRGATPGDEVALGSTTGGAFDVVVVAGTYAVHYAQDTSNGTVPLNTNARIADVDATVDTVVDVDIPTAFVSGVITIGAGAPPDSDYDDGWVYLRNAATGDTVLLASTRMGQFAAPVVPGTYEVTYAVETAGGEVPISAEPIRLFDIDVDGDTSFDVDVPVRSLRGAIGSAAQSGDRGALFLRATTGNERSLLGDTATAFYDQRVVPGRYVLAYGFESGGGALPRNSDAALACIELAGR
jgi:hypothetical protein